ncbi:hypothetical protein JCM9279_003317 [Rhodotorula babjevae]
MSTPLNPAAAPFLPAATSPPSLDSLTITEDQPVVPWHRLPVELKQKIIGEVLYKYEQNQSDSEAVDLADKAVGFFARREILEEAAADAEFEKQRELERLRAVSRDFFTICGPLFWQRLWVDPLAAPALDNLLEVLPPRASLVRCVDVTPFEDDGDEVDEANDVELYDPEVRQRALAIVNCCANVQEIYVDERVVDVSGINLGDLHIVTLRTFSFSNVIPFLSHTFQTLASLQLALYKVDGGRRDRLITDLVTTLPSLKHLLIEGEAVMSEASFDLSSCTGIVAQLESLELISYDVTVGFATLQAFVGLFSKSLVQLAIELHDIVDEPWQVPSGETSAQPRSA